MESLTERALNRLGNAAANYLDKQIEFKPPPTTAYYLGYDNASGRHRVKLLNGSILSCTSNSTGVYAVGDKVALSIASLGATPIIDTMPR